MTARWATWRVDVALGLMVLALTGLGVRLAVMVRDHQGDARERARRQERMVLPLPARIGNIYASTRGRYVLLAGSRQVPSCFIDPSLIEPGEVPAVARNLAEALDLRPEVIVDTIDARRGRRFAWLARAIPEQRADAVRALDHPGVAVAYEWRREYPLGRLGGSVVGFRRVDGVAGGGIEVTLDPLLSARPGRRVMLADARRRAIWPVPDQCFAPRDGNNVYLCLDAVIQEYLQDSLRQAVDDHDAQWGAGVVVDPQTGEVLAMCSTPSFHPAAYAVAPAEARTNRVITSPYEPGSIFKPIVAAAAVELGTVGYDTTIPIGQYDGVYHAHRGGRISDHGKRYDDMTVADGIRVSSNILMAKLGEKLGNRLLWEIVTAFGFGEETGIDLGGESAGIVRPLEKWDGYSLRRVPFGQEISATTLQMAMAYSALVNGGVLLRPRLVARVTTSDGRLLARSKPVSRGRLLSPEVSAQTRRVLRSVVEDGTGKACRLDRWTSLGKTGTAQVAGRGGYLPGAYTASFVGAAPAERPALVVVVSVYRPDPSTGYYGGAVAAPVVREVLRRSLAYLGVPPDREQAPAVAAAR